MARADEGLRSEELREALQEALGGRPDRLEGLLARHGEVLRPVPNLKLAAAFGSEVAALPGPVTRLLTRLGAEEAAPDTARAFLPVAAAHGWVARLRAQRDTEAAWGALAELAADERAPVRVGTRDALLTWAQREGGADVLVARATAWLEEEDRERRYGAAALVVEVLGDKRVVAAIQQHEALFGYLSRTLAEAAEAPRAAARSDARRRLLTALARALATAVASSTGGEAGARWLHGECAGAEHPEVRAALSNALVTLRSPAFGQGAAVVEPLRAALEGSAKPPRDPTRLRPGQGRGKASRRIR